MLQAEWRRESGWSAARITRLAPFRLSPFAGVLHYAQSIFEGLKARALPSGALAVFRARDHAARFARSAQRMAMPVLPEADFLDCVAAFTRHQARRVGAGEALYLRPVLFAAEEMLGARPAGHYIFAILGAVVTEPVHAGLRLYVEPELARVGPGGTGVAKAAGNYAAALLAGARAQERGYHQALFLDARTRTCVEETAGMNVVFVQGDTVLTPPLGDTILDGITRRSVLALAPALGLQIAEQPLPWLELLAGLSAGRISEVFGLGTAAGVAGVAHIGSAAGDVDVSGGEVAGRLQAALRSEQLGAGRHPDWLFSVNA